MLRRALILTLWDTYDALGRLLIGNLLWFALSLPWWGGIWLLSRVIAPPASTLLLLTALPVAYLNPGGAGLAEMAQRLAETRDTDVATFWLGVRRHFWRSMLLTSIGAFSILTLGASLLFYGGGVLNVLGTYVNLFAVGATLWALVIIAGMGCYWMPVAVGIEGTEPRVGFILRRSALLTLDNPLFTLGVLLSTAVCSVFWVGTVIGVPALGMSFIRIFHARARIVLREKYEVLNELKSRGASVTRASIRIALRKRWAKTPKRGLRELIKPWE